VLPTLGIREHGFLFYVTFSGRTGRLVNAHPEPGDVKAFVAVVVNTSNRSLVVSMTT
jgi:hypothetical protein